MTIWLCLSIFCGGMLAGFGLRCLMLMEYQDGVHTGYHAAKAAEIPLAEEVLVIDCSGDYAVREMEVWEDA